MATQVLIKTTLGDIKVELYDQTPQHRDNFIKLVKEGYYNGTLFHRVIKNFMVMVILLLPDPERLWILNLPMHT